ncbi:hypothetical protein RFI_30061 [Reticulomyxa filosa]|uniref:Uncharacterized protein n=1 Tax=Reticulomyxa filosa TaxID=46433 RepID=X6M1N9_RETFI|nr:hypothetical protein RFI_30061 [Reticulomyxa filosa]|eukprot:ETO07332.1 hypothetical protein RFI_30061 [Reticulomyxa filosa]
MIRTFLTYYRDNINQVYEQVIPKSYVISFDYENHKFIFNDPNFIKDILSTKVDQCMRTLKKKKKFKIITFSRYQINNEIKKKNFLLERINLYAWLDYPAQREMEMTLVVSKYIKFDFGFYNLYLLKKN